MGNFKDDIKVPERKIFGKRERDIRLELDAYRDFINSQLPSFVNFMEAINKGLVFLEDKYIMSNIGFRARVKDPVGALRISNIKPLDDLFGFELTTPNNVDKELLMLLINSILDDRICSRSKKHNKSNGYNAYHRVGVLGKEDVSYDIEDLKQIISTSKMIILKRKYRDLSRAEQKEIPIDELYQTSYIYNELKERLDRGFLGNAEIKAIIDVRNVIFNEIEPEKKDNNPPIEFQFKTEKVAEEAKFGTASHCNYKNVRCNEIIERYNGNKLIRGIDYPFAFRRTEDGMILESSDKTLLGIYPFLRDSIVKSKANTGNKNLNYNMHFATVFPALKPYIIKLSEIEPSYIIKTTDADSIWNDIKLRIINPNYLIPEHNILDLEEYKKGVVAK